MIAALLSVVSAIPLYFYFTGEKYSDNRVIKKLFKNFVWIYTKFEIASDNLIKYVAEEPEEEIVLQSVIEMEDYSFYEYKIRYKEHSYYITLVNENGNNHYQLKLEKLKQNLEKKLDNKNLIVHCSLVNADDDIVLDVTEDFRKFKYYYDENKEKTENNLDIKSEHSSYTPYTKYFFEYLQNKYPKLDLHDLSLMIYKNDEQFTELRHRIENLYTKTFWELLN